MSIIPVVEEFFKYNDLVKRDGDLANVREGIRRTTTDIYCNWKTDLNEHFKLIGSDKNALDINEACSIMHKEMDTATLGKSCGLFDSQEFRNMMTEIQNTQSRASFQVGLSIFTSTSDAHIVDKALAQQREAAAQEKIAQKQQSLVAKMAQIAQMQKISSSLVLNVSLIDPMLDPSQLGQSQCPCPLTLLGCFAPLLHILRIVQKMKKTRIRTTRMKT
ncbi:hypothetical protein TorRG33x02_178330 [Trema orientale]|uniref:Uncharacterized protein n=1 Tax=Trema orientale TaxID=63057 RepID=A0A2P5ELG8_TREOI|nr:hypothetical protein TorRG33x02_178330 [Trema orientale]